jgi:GMP synthase-like glutamine amidotransferase
MCTAHRRGAAIESLQFDRPHLSSACFSGFGSMITRALVFQHMDDEPPGLFGEFLVDRGARLDTVMLHRGQAIPSLAPYDFLLVMGGSMDVWEEAEHPWLIAEKQAIREWAVNRHRPYFGVCLGLQLLAESLGGKVGLSREAEVGIGTIEITRSAPLTRNLPPQLQMMQWHHAEVTELPPGAEVLASSLVTSVQIMAVGDCLAGTQFHGELTPELVDRWAHLPAYIDWLEAALGPGAYGRVRSAALPLMPAMRKVSENMFNAVVDGIALRQAA